MASNNVGPEDYFVSEDTQPVAEGLQPDVHEGYTEDEVSGLLRRMAEEAINWRTEHLDPHQVLATKYYRGEPFGNEEDGRSQIVITTVRDAIRRTLPSLLRVFHGPEDVVEYAPRNADDVEKARHITKAINYFIREDNPGFLNFYSWFKDALLMRLGAVKWWHETSTTVEVEQYEGMTATQVALLVSQYDEEPGIEVEVDSTVSGSNDMGENLYDVALSIHSTDGRVRFAVLPPEETIWSPSARSVEDAPMVGHVRDVPADELIDMGVDPDLVDMHRGRTRPTHEGTLQAARRQDEGEARRQGDEQDPATEPIQFAELYARLDVDDDGVAELRRFDCIGDRYVVVNGDGYGEPVDEIPMAFLCPDPEAHDFVGLSQADSTMDLQKIKSFVTRGMLDSLAASIDPVTEVVQNEVNMQDVLSRKLSRIIRVKKPGMVREVDHRWLGGDALPALEYLDRVMEDRIGATRESVGLDPSSLQSTTASAVSATVQGQQQQLEMVARVFAETGIRDLYKGLLRLVVKHADSVRRRTVRLDGGFVEIDPREWDATLDVKINVQAGSGLIEQKLATLQAVLQQQLQLMEAQSPLVSWEHVRTTLQKIVTLSGWPQDEAFFAPFGPQEAEQYAQQQAQAAQEPSPAELLMQLEREKLQAKVRQEQIENEMERQRDLMEDDRERDKIARDFALQSEELRLKYAAQSEQSQLNAIVEADRTAQDADVRRQEAAMQAASNPPSESPGGQGGGGAAPADSGESAAVDEPNALGLPPVPQAGAFFGSGISPDDLEE